MKMVEKEMERLIANAGKTAPRLTPEHVDAKIKSTTFYRHGETTICVLTLENGFDVIGHSGCASPANFDAKIGETIARQKARDQIWMLEGYLLRERLYRSDDD